MLDAILLGLRQLDGVHGALVIDSAAAVIAHRAHAIYDAPVLQHLARSAIKAVESMQLVDDDWDLVTARFDDGMLLLRSVRLAQTGRRPRRYVLAVIADATLNLAMVGTAMRVAAGKLQAELEAAPPAPVAAVGSSPAIARPRAAAGATSSIASRLPLPPPPLELEPK